MFRVFSAAILVAGLAAAQAFPLKSLRIEGNQRIEAARIVAASGLVLGAPVDKPQFDAARDKLIATAVFQSVGYEYNPSADKLGYDAVFRVAEQGSLYPYRFEDLAGDAQALREAVRKAEPMLGDTIPGTPELLARLARAVESVAGGPVAGFLSSDARDPAVVFRPTSGRKNVAEVQFTGNKVIDSGTLTRVFSASAVGTVFTETSLRERLDAGVRPLYEAKGRLRVSFPKVAIERHEKIDGLVVTISVDEGEEYKLGEITVRGTTSKLADLKKGELADMDAVEASLKQLYEKYKNDGYLYVSGKIDRTVDDAAHRVDLTVTLTPGAQYRFGKLSIKGLDIISEPQIRKVWGMEGKPFQPGYPEAFLKRLREEDVFDNLGKTKADTNIHEDTKLVDVELTFEGTPVDPKDVRPRRR